jgi:NAD(P)-dependent dehydrogenase (short-subunit alcohol dehydrogenase family)
LSISNGEPILKLDGLKAVVTGSGGGIGGAIAVALARNGADVALNDRVPEHTHRQEDACRAAGRDVICVTANVTKRDGAERLICAAQDRWGRVDILVNVVGGIKGPVINPIADITEEQWEMTIGLNLRGTYHCTRLIVPGMVKRRFGKIVSISSVSWAGEAAHAHYAAAKAGVVAFTRSVAAQLGPHNINVNAIAPGPTGRYVEVDLAPPETGTPAMWTIGSGTLGRPNEPDDIANAALFLVSEDSRNISGQVLNVAGGLNPSYDYIL